VYELDAASRTGVDHVREEIIGRVSFAPTRGRYKIYIIDEVHMLSTAAFNALLKTLEEPPAHVVFVMCTTHPNKVPDTIQSRCQRFDFRRLSVEDIADRLRYIAESEGMEVDRGAFTLIARHAQGGMRDAITDLEQIAAFTGGEVTSDDVEGMLGEVDSVQLFEVAGLIARRDIAAGFRWVASMVETGTELAELVRELTGHVRDLFVIAAVGDATGVVDRSADELSRLQSQAAEFGGPDRLARVLDILGELSAEMRWSSDPRLSFEVALTRIARPQGETTLEALAERVEVLERGGVAAGTMPVGQDRGVSIGSADEHAAHDVLPGTIPAAKSAEHAAHDALGDDAEITPENPAALDASEAPRVVEEPSNESSPAPSVSVPDPEPTAPAVEPGARRRPGKLDRSAVKRDWHAVLVEIKRRKPARVQTFTNVEVEVDADGETLVIEFPSDQSFSMQLAQEPDNRELVKTALAAVFGSAMPFRYQLGRGAVRPAAEPGALQAEEPAAPPEQELEVAETPAPDPPEEILADEPVADDPPAEQEADPAPEGPVTASELEQLLSGMGATIVEERSATGEEEESK
jgi:DNA polymerase-3 subunit gamma/tau